MRSNVTSLLIVLVLGGQSVAPGLGGQAARTPPDPARAAGMRDHYTQVLAVHAAVISGRLPDVARAASELAQYEAPGPASRAAAEAIDAIRLQAGRAGRAADIVTAAYATARMLAACGDCHKAAGVMPAAPLPDRPQVGTIVGHMLEHQRAADELLQGLVVPSNSLWTAGAKGFLTAPLRAGDLGRTEERDRRMIDTEQRLHRIAGDALQATDSLARAGFYAQLLAGCADCHRRQ